MKGVKAKQVGELDQPDKIKLPESPTDLKDRERVVKEMKVLGREIKEKGSFAKSKIEEGVVVMEDMIKAYWVMQKLKENENDQYIMPVAKLSEATAKFFKLCFVG